MKKKGFIVTAVLILIGVLGVGFWQFIDGAKESPYITAAVQKGTIRQVVSATGTLQAVVTVQVGSQISGTIVKLYADFNSKVRQGQVVAELDQDKFKAVVEQAKANLVSAEANLAKANVTLEDSRRNLMRAAELRKRELVAQSELDAAQTAYDAALAQLGVNRAQVEQAKASLDQASVDLAHTIIRSPVDGIVVSRNVDVGQTVAASLQAPILFTIANDLSKMEVHTSVDEADIGNVSVKQEVSFTVDAYPTKRFRGKVSQVRNAPTTVQNVVTYDAVVGIDNSELLLKPGMTTNVEFLVSQKSDVLKIPNMALRFRAPWERQEAQELMRQAGRSGGAGAAGRRRPRSDSAASDGRLVKVYLVRNNQPAPVQVRVGITDGSFTEMIEGEIEEKEPIVLGISDMSRVSAPPGVTNPFQSPTRGFGWFR